MDGEMQYVCISCIYLVGFEVLVSYCNVTLLNYH